MTRAYGGGWDGPEEEKFPRASELRQESVGINNARVKAALEELRIALRAAASKGETQLWHHHTWGTGVVQTVMTHLSTLGYKSASHDDQRDGSSLEVSW